MAQRAEASHNSHTADPAALHLVKRGSRSDPKKNLNLTFVVIVLVAISAGAVVFHRLWPFTPEGVAKRLHQHTSATMQYTAFHQLFFPHPGFVAEQVTMRRDPAAPPSVTVQKITVLCSYFGLIGTIKSISNIHAEGLVVRISAEGAAHNLEFHRSSHQGQLQVEHLIADGATLEVSSAQGARPLVFPIVRLRMDTLAEHSAGKFDVVLQNPKPEMQIAAQGAIGPWSSDGILHTPLAGSFSVSNGQLQDIPGISGTLTGSGQFTGEMDNIVVAGGVNVPAFEVRYAHHPMPLSVQFTTAVSTPTGEINLQSVSAQLASTHITGSGVILPHNDRSNAANLRLTGDRGRVDDLLRLFVSSPQPAMSGPLRFRALAIVERGTKPLLQRVRLDGNFVVNDAHFTSAATQDKVNELGARSQGHPNESDPRDSAISLLASEVSMKDGVAKLSNVNFQVPGADATGSGTFNVLNTKVHLDGKLRTAAELSHTTKGVKSVLLKFLDPIFKKHNAGAEVPVFLRGTLSNPRLKVGLK